MSVFKVTAKLNNIDPQALLADVLARMPDMSISRLHQLLPWQCKDCNRIEED